MTTHPLAPIAGMFRRKPQGLVIGKRFDGKPLIFPWPEPWVGHVLIAGLIGSGKSTYMNALIGGAAADPDTAVIGTDLKGGIELRPWHPRMTDLATTPVEATNQLWRLSRLARERMAIVVANGADRWNLDDGPIILAAFDEIAELAAIDGDAIGAYLADPVNNRLSDAKEDRKIRLGLLSSITRLCRALGITVVCATQHPLAEIVPTDLRSQLSIRIAGRVTGREQIDVALGEGMGHHIAPDAISIGEPGVAHVLGLPGCPIPTRCRSSWATKDEIRARAAATAHLTHHPSEVFPDGT